MTWLNIRLNSYEYASRYLKFFCTKDHGLKHVFIRSGFMTIFWLIAFITVYITTAYMINEAYKNYKEYPLITHIKIDESQFEFPDVTICPKSPFSDNIDDDFIQKLDKLKNQTYNALKKANVKITQEYLQAAILLQLLGSNYEYGPKLFMHIIYCTYNGIECSFYNFTEIIHPRYLRCFKFIPDKRKIRAGEGLTVFYYTGKLLNSTMFLNDLEDLNVANSEKYDGINVIVHPPLTFPSYQINYVPTSFPLHYGTFTELKVKSLKYSSNDDTEIPCYKDPIKYQYKNFHGQSNFMEYNYTHEDCIFNKKQEYIKKECSCYSDEIFVPYNKDDNIKIDNFCRYIPGKTSDEIRHNFFCHEIISALSSSEILDKYISPELLLKFKGDPNKLKSLRLQICQMLCNKLIYNTNLYDVHQLNEHLIKARYFENYKQKLELGKFNNSIFMQLYNNDDNIPGENLVVFEIKSEKETIDIWEEDRSLTWVNLASEIGGILNLCPGISFLMAVLLVIYFSICLISYVIYIISGFVINYVFEKVNKSIKGSQIKGKSERTSAILKDKIWFDKSYYGPSSEVDLIHTDKDNKTESSKIKIRDDKTEDKNTDKDNKTESSKRKRDDKTGDKKDKNKSFAHEISSYSPKKSSEISGDTILDTNSELSKDKTVTYGIDTAVYNEKTEEPKSKDKQDQLFQYELVNEVINDEINAKNSDKSKNSGKFAKLLRNSTGNLQKLIKNDLIKDTVNKNIPKNQTKQKTYPLFNKITRKSTGSLQSTIPNDIIDENIIKTIKNPKNDQTIRRALRKSSNIITHSLQKEATNNLINENLKKQQPEKSNELSHEKKSNFIDNLKSKIKRSSTKLSDEKSIDKIIIKNKNEKDKIKMKNIQKFENEQIKNQQTNDILKQNETTIVNPNDIVNIQNKIPRIRVSDSNNDTVDEILIDDSDDIDFNELERLRLLKNDTNSMEIESLDLPNKANWAHRIKNWEVE